MSKLIQLVAYFAGRDGWLWQSVRDLLPIVVVVGIFQVFVFRQPLHNGVEILVGFGLVLTGLTLFIAGLETGLFPLGEQMAHDFATKGSVTWLVAFAFALGAGTTFAEPALIAVAAQAAELRAGDGELAAGASQSYQRALRVTVALAVGVALVMGVLRIVMGWPAYYLLLPAYLLFVILTPFAPHTVVGLAYDIGAMTMSTVTVPLTAALGIGLASSIKGRSPLTDGFGVIALAAIIPSLSVLVRGIVWP